MGTGAGVGVGMGVGVGAGRGVGGGVGVAVGAGVGRGVGPGVGAAVGSGVRVGVGAGVAVAPADGRGGVPLGPGCAVLGVGESPDDSVAVAPATVSDGGTDWLGPPDVVTTVAGVPIAPSTAPVGWSGVPMMNARMTATRATAIAATGAPRAMRRRLGAGPRRRASPAVDATATEAPQPGHAPPERAQHLPQANTPHDEHADSPIPARVAAGPIRLPHRSQNGSGAPPAGRNGLREIIGNDGEPPVPARPDCHHDPRHPDPLRRSTAVVARHWTAAECTATPYAALEAVR